MTIRLKGEALTSLRDEVMLRDGMRCVECGRKVWDDAPDWAPNKAHLAHKTGRGRGGEDTAENTETRCLQCHFEGEHQRKAIPRKWKP